MRSLFAAALLLSASASWLTAGPLTEARIARIINDVSVFRPANDPRPATLNQVVKDDLVVKTGVKSRSELLFQDETLTRLGPESLFSFTAGTRDLSLDRGTMLLQVPKNLGGATIHTAAVTASITGTTIMLEHRPGQSLKVLVLEGSLRLSLDRHTGESLVLTPGKMIVMPPDAKHIPTPITIDLAKVMKTSSLVKMSDDAKPLPSVALIEAAAQDQVRSMAHDGQPAAEVAIPGEDSSTSNNIISKTDVHLAAMVMASPAPGITDNSPVVESSMPDPTPAPTPLATPASTPAPTLVAAATPAEPTSSATPAPTPVAAATPAADDDSDALVINYGTSTSPRKEDVNINDSYDFSAGGRHARVNVTTEGKIEIKKTIKVSSNAPESSRRGGSITLESRRTNGDAIKVSDSGQLLSLLNAAAPGPGGKVLFVSAGGKVQLDKATVVAERGTIEIRNEGAKGVVELNRATLNADTIKVHSLGEKGQLNIGGGTISADSVIELYATGSNGEVTFTENTTLSGKSVKRIAGDTVTIKNGKTVTVNGPAPASVFTNHANYTGSGGNGSTTGIFSGAGATTQPLVALTGGH